MLVVSKVTLELCVGGAKIVVPLPKPPKSCPNMPGLQAFSVKVEESD